MSNSDQKIHISVIVTVLNEAETITQLLDALLTQTFLPSEIIIVDGGSTDQTRELISSYQKQFPKAELRLFKHRGHISSGRNFAAEQARHRWLAITDAGCIPRSDWLAELVEKQRRTGAEVVAGFYAGRAQTKFEVAVVPYVLVMPDQLDPDTFLPASRSMLIKKSLFERLGGFDEKLVVSEDYDFAHRLRKMIGQEQIAVAPRAIVEWLPRQNLKEFFVMISRQAEWDVRADRWRVKVGLVWARYLLGLVLLISAWYFRQEWLLVLLGAGLAVYLLWAIAKNGRYAVKAWYWLPVLQLTADLAVLKGSFTGTFL